MSLDNIGAMHDIGSLIAPRFAGAGDVVAAGAGDNAAINGPWIDRKDAATLGVYESCVVGVAWQGVLAATKTLSLAIKLQDADDASGANGADYGAVGAPAVVATGPTGGATKNGATNVKFSLAGARQFVRAVVTPDLSNTATDTAIIATLIIFGGAQRVPTTL